jgi:hypothetical protein
MYLKVFLVWPLNFSDFLFSDKAHTNHSAEGEEAGFHILGLLVSKQSLHPNSTLFWFLWHFTVLLLLLAHWLFLFLLCLIHFISFFAQSVDTVHLLLKLYHFCVKSHSKLIDIKQQLYHFTDIWISSMKKEHRKDGLTLLVRFTDLEWLLAYGLESPGLITHVFGLTLRTRDCLLTAFQAGSEVRYIL